LCFLLFTALAVWIFGKFGSAIEKRIKRVLILFLTLLIITLAAIQFVDLEKKSETNKILEGPWQKFSSELVQQYRLEEKPVFIDFYADWCTSCKVNDAAVLNTQKIMDIFKVKNVQLLKGDFTAGNREIARWLSDYDRAGVPLYILFRPGEDAILFPEFLTQHMIEKELNLIEFNNIY
jgi:thiol:disulfide interchange protein